MHNTDVLLTFTCKGLGTNAANMVFFFLTLASTQQGVLGEPDNVTFNYRLSIGLSLVMLFGILPYRIMSEESAQFKEMVKKQKEQKIQSPGYGILFSYYGLRLVGTMGSWFLWDIIQYGNSLFSKQITGAFVSSCFSGPSMISSVLMAGNDSSLPPWLRT